MSDTTHARIAPLEPPYSDEVAELLAKWMPPGADVEPLALFRTLAVNPDLAARMRPLGAGILGHGKVEPRIREVMIHRTCALCGAEYEWGVHAVAFGRPLGFTDQQVAATVTGDWRDPVWSEAEGLTIRLADELHAHAEVSDELFAGLREHFDDAQILELVVTAGWYHTIAYVLGVALVPLEPWAERFPGGA